jgi:acyl carrier protein
MRAIRKFEHFTLLQKARPPKMDIRSTIVDQFHHVAQEQDKRIPELTDDLPLLESGLDSLCFAIIIARLEDAVGHDPFSAEDVLFPVTFGEFVSCYEAFAK